MALIFNNGILGSLFGDNKSSFGTDNSLPIDIVFEESQAQKFLITSRPTQKGGSFSDNIVTLPQEFSCDGFFKSNLIGDTWRDKKEALDELARTREPFDLVNHLGVFPDVFFTEINSVANREFNDVLKFTASLKQIPTISSESKRLPPAAFKNPQVGAPSVDKGKVQGEPAKGNESSLLFSMFGV
jgi:hypothetical protein